MGIRDEFHQCSILECIEELRSGRPIFNADYALVNYTKSNSSAISGTSIGNLQSPSSTSSSSSAIVPSVPKQIHDMTQYSFSSLRKCDQCHKYLRGIIHQGMLCKKCGTVAHRTCARLGIQSMHCVFKESNAPSTINGNETNSLNAGNLTDSVQPITSPPPPLSLHLSYFGNSLCTMFDPNDCKAPEILQLCCAEIERQAKHTDHDLYRLYQSNLTSSEIVNLLRTKLHSDLRSVNFGDYSLQCIVAVMKKFLRELPDPVIPVQFYDYFIQASSKHFFFYMS